MVGLLEVVNHLRRLRAIFRVLDEVDRERPDVAVLVDYPDFNLRLARELKRRGVPVVYYVSPQVWAWRRGRIRTIRETVARMLVIFPFEEAIYREAGVPVTFVGHPAARPRAARAPDRAAFLAARGSTPRDRCWRCCRAAGRRRSRTTSRRCGRARRIGQRRADLQFASPRPPACPRLFDRDLAGLPVARVAGHTHALGAASVGIVASGTATVEAALRDLPMVVVYRVSPLTYALGRPFCVCPFAMVNLIAGRAVVPELIQGDFTAEAVANEALALLEDPGRRDCARIWPRSGAARSPRGIRPSGGGRGPALGR